MLRNRKTTTLSVTTVIAATALVLAGCSSHGGAAAATSAAGATAAPAGAPWSVSVAQAQFGTMVGPVVADFARFQAVPATGPVSSFRSVAALLAIDEQTLVTSLRRGRWPATAQPAMAAMATALASEQAVFSRIAAVTTLPQVTSLVAGGATTHAQVELTSSQARVAIGLPAS